MAGRRTMLTPDVHKTIVDALRAGSYLPEAAGLAGVAERTVYQWLQKGNEALDLAELDTDPNNTPSEIAVPTDHPAWGYAQFAQAVMEARAAAKVEAVATVRQAIVGRPNTYDQEGRLIHSERPPEWRAALEFLARTDSENWARTWRRGDERKENQKADDVDVPALEDQVGTADDEKMAALGGLDELTALREAHLAEESAAKAAGDV